MVGIQIHTTVNCRMLKHWMVVLLLLWSCIKVAENLQPGRTQRAAPYPRRAKRGWVWNQFVVPEEMDIRQHVGQKGTHLNLLLVYIFSLGTFVIKVTANDADDPATGYHARILYNLEKGQPYFSVEPTTGFYRFTVSESAPSGTTIGKIMAYDDDIGDNAKMDYSIEDDDSEIFDIITDNETQEGIIILKKKVDFEHQNHYGIRAKVKNHHVDKELASAHVNASSTYIKVQVEDEDEPPAFLLPYYIFGIPEEKQHGSIVGTVSAIDIDRRQSPIRYSITGSKMFHIHDNGTIITTNLLDREVSAWYNLSVTATETYNEQQMSSAPVYVQVFNINDHAPEFSQYYETYVCENAEYDNTAVILTNRTGFSLKEEPVFSMIIFIADNGIPSLTSTNTLTIQVCDCGESGSTETCTSKGLLFIMGFKTELIIAILLCITVIFGFVFLMLAMKQRRKQTQFPEKSEEFGENKFCYDDEGGREEDSEAYDIVELRSSAVIRERKSWRSKSAEIRSFYRQSLQVGPDTAIFRKFILEKLEEANTDPCAPPFDSLQTFAFEGTGSSAGSLSSLGSKATDQEDNFDYLNDLGPRFKRLACMFGSTMQTNN
ncbi:Cdh19 [Phodopus roborovskii]|uniref:Cdh19 protein n=1 Tax=Phodopus roborovskii TaxID=109678 RepID=A0AAV0A356_PHORO|nr:Cdh19 [Phodopus roborovskii]